MSNSRISLFALIALVGLATATRAQATLVTCIDPADGSGRTAQQQLDIALSNWQLDSTQLYEIHIVQGTHILSGSTQYAQGISGNNGYGDLNLRGGYGPGCHTRTLLASNTVLTGNMLLRMVITPPVDTASPADEPRAAVFVLL